MKAEQPLWGRGIMISPQHFQQQVAYAAWSVECIARMGLNHPWGVIESTFEPEALKLGRLKAHKLHVRFQDGTLVDTDMGNWPDPFWQSRHFRLDCMADRAYRDAARCGMATCRD